MTETRNQERCSRQVPKQSYEKNLRPPYPTQGLDPLYLTFENLIRATDDLHP